MLKQFIKGMLTRKMINILKSSYFNLLDLRDRLLGRRGFMFPPRYLQYLTGGRADYEKIGQTFLSYFKKFGRIQPDSQILEVGSGTGRMAIPLMSYLNEQGRYVGFDIMSKAIVWCQKNISTKYPHFSFQLANVYNLYYNPNGGFEAHEYRFPYDDNVYDFVFLTSVFTHMLPADLENYLSEIARVMKSGGRCLVSYFVLNEESLASMEKDGVFNFQYIFEHYRLVDVEIPEIAVAYDEQYLRDLYEKCGLKIIDSPRYGSWSGRKESFDFQDILIATKE